MKHTTGIKIATWSVIIFHILLIASGLMIFFDVLNSLISWKFMMRDFIIDAIWFIVSYGGVIISTYSLTILASKSMVNQVEKFLDDDSLF